MNTIGFNLDNIDILILDEADRLLELGFIEQIKYIINECQIQRQTMLFSATMTNKVEQLITLSLNNPIRIKINDVLVVNKQLKQEFIRIRNRNIIYQEAMLLCICINIYKNHKCIGCIDFQPYHDEDECISDYSCSLDDIVNIENC